MSLNDGGVGKILSEYKDALESAGSAESSSHHKLRNRAIHQAYIAKLGMRGLVETNLSVFSEDALRCVTGTLSLEFGSILKADPENQALLLTSGIGWSKGSVGRAVLPAGKASHVGYSLLTRGPVVFENLSEERRFEDQNLRKQGIASGLAAVIRGRQEPFGVLAAYSREPRKFHAEDLEFLQAVANIVGAAIDRKRSEHAQYSGHDLFRAFFDQAAVGIAQLGEQHYFELVNSKFCQIVGFPEEDLIGKKLEELIHTDYQEELARHVVEILSGEKTECAHEARFIRNDGREGWAQLTISSLASLPVRARSVLCFVEDITERKRSEELKEVLAAELDHRVKNVLAMVLSLAKQTLARQGSVEGFKKSFESRLLAMSDIHTLLNRNRWTGAALEDIVQQVMLPYQDLGENRIVIEGASIPLTSQQAQSLYLMLYELAANAAKYGALSAGSGRLHISWEKKIRDGKADVCLRWQENGGPRVPVKIKKGFGHTLIERTAGYELQGKVSLTFEPEGVTCALQFPLQKEQRGIHS